MGNSGEKMKLIKCTGYWGNAPIIINVDDISSAMEIVDEKQEEGSGYSYCKIHMKSGHELAVNEPVSKLLDKIQEAHTPFGCRNMRTAFQITLP
jgi:nucleoid-associated protein YejK